MRKEIRWLVAAVGVCLLCLGVATASAQRTSTTETKDFEVISVDGNKLVLRGAEGTKEFTVPADFRFNVGGEMLAVSALKPGMKGTATITTTTTSKPVHVTEVRNGEVLKTTGGSVMVRTDQGIRNFTQGEIDKRNITIIRGGAPVRISDLRVGDRLSATFVTAGPPEVMTERDVQASVTPGAAPPATVTATPAPAAAPAAGAYPAKTLPETASPLPLIGLIGTAAVALGYTLTLRRRRK